MFGLPLEPMLPKCGTMQRPSRDRFRNQPGVPTEPPCDPAQSLERAARIADVKDRMIGCLEELDRLGLPYAANYLCHAIEIIPEGR